MKQSIRFSMLLCALWLTAVTSSGFVTCITDDGQAEIQAHHHTLMHSRCSANRSPEPVETFTLAHEHHSCRYECAHIAVTCIAGPADKVTRCSCGCHAHGCPVQYHDGPVRFSTCRRILPISRYRTDPLLRCLSATILRI